jgi:hypothetical protein
MHLRHLVLCMLGVFSFACGGAREPSVGLNQQLALTTGGSRQLIETSCVTYQHGQPTPGADAQDRGIMPFPFQHVASRAPDLEIGQIFNGRYVRVIARAEGNPGLPPAVKDRTYTFDFLMSGGRDTFTLERADGSTYELQYAGGDCVSAGNTTD